MINANYQSKLNYRPKLTLIQPSKDEFRAWYDQWIEIRRTQGVDIDIRDCQFEKLWEMITSPFGIKYVLAVGTGGGKTLMAIIYICWRVYCDPSYRILVSTHGQVGLRDQFNNKLELYKCEYLLVSNLLVCIPQNIIEDEKLNNLGHFDEIIVDEAHQLYSAKYGDKDKVSMVQKIIQKIKPIRQILLTATPSEFVCANKIKPNSYDISYLDAHTLWHLGIIQDVYLEVASTTYDLRFDTKDYNREGDLKTNVVITNDQIKSALTGMMEKIMHRLTSRFKNDPEKYKRLEARGYNYISILGADITSLFRRSIGKTMITCRNISEAAMIKDFLLDYGYTDSEIMQSTSEKINKDRNIQDFTTTPDIKFLIVVYRGVLGFDCPELCNIIDLTCSRNVNRNLQLFGRLVRKSDNDLDKFFYKVVPDDLVYYFQRFMGAVMHLMHEYYLSKFDGRNFVDMKIVKRPVYDENVNEDNIDKTEKNKGKKIVILSFTETFDEIFQLNLLNHMGGKLIDSKCYSSLRTVMQNIDMCPKIIKWNGMNDEEVILMHCQAHGSRYKNAKEWEKRHYSTYKVAFDRDIIDKCLFNKSVKNEK